MTTAARSVLVTLALVLGTLGLSVAPGAAGPPTIDRRTPHPECTHSNGHFVFVGFSFDHMDCSDATAIARHWAHHCPWAIAAHPCAVPGTVRGVAATFSCTGQMTSFRPPAFSARCHDDRYRWVSWKFHP